MKITHVISSLEVGGAEMFLARLLRGSPKLAEDAEVIGLKDMGPVASLFSAAGARVTALGLKGTPFAAPAPARLRAHIARRRPDVVQTWLYHADLLGGIAAWGLAPVVWNLRLSNVESASLSSSARLALRFSARLSRRVPAAVICCSKSTLDEHVRLGYDASKMRVIHNGFEVVHGDVRGLRSRMRSALSLPPDAFVIGNVGRWHPMKNHLGLVAAIAPIVERHVRVHVVLAGLHVDEANVALHQTVRSTASPERFHLLGLRSDVADLMSCFDLLVSASQSEGLPNVVGEAMAAGVPCVCTDAGDSALLVGPTGRVVPRHDRQALTSAIEDFVAMPAEERRRRGMAASERIATTFSLRGAAERYLDLYEDVTARRR